MINNELKERDIQYERLEFEIIQPEDDQMKKKLTLLEDWIESQVITKVSFNSSALTMEEWAIVPQNFPIR